MKNKYIAFLLLMFFLLSVVFYFVFNNNKTSINTRPTPKTSTLTITPSLRPLVPGAPQNITFTLEGSIISLPTELPTYSISFLPQSDLENIAKTFAKNFGYTQQPETKPRPNGYIMIWSDPKGYFSFINNGEQHSYSVEQYASNQNFTFPSSPLLTLLSKIYSFTDTKGFLPLQAPTQGFEGMVFLDGRPKHLTRQLYSYMPDGKYPLLMVNYSKTVLSGVFDDKGSVRTFVFHVPPFLQKTASVKIKSQDDIVSALSDQKGVLVSSQKNEVWGSLTSFSRVVITNIEIAYFPDKTQKIAYPVFLLSGHIEGRLDTTIQYLLPAAY